MSNYTVLIVEDEDDVVELLRYNLARNGYRVETVTTGPDAISRAGVLQPDLILLDLMLPGMDGLEVCRTLKKENRTERIPIIMVTAKGDEADVVAGLEMGADDYITKPFSPRVLMARVKAVLRRPARTKAPEPGSSPTVRIHQLEIDPGRHRVLVKDKQVELTSTEFALLYFLASRPGWVFTRYQIVDAVHGSDYPVTDRSIDVQIVGLRRKLGTVGTCIETVRGVGYRFKDSEDR
ncbi:MAG: response regulator transcription factor [Phycisphaerae bacterium]|nr:response regulator transcription factor [Phycisphaerae bacterium]